MTNPVRILVVDDEADVEVLLRQHFRRELRAGEFAFEFACNGEEALGMLEADAGYAMVLSDINMPKMDGLTLLGHIAERFSDINTVVVSAYGDLRNIRTAMNRGAFDFVTKPIEFADLDATIRKTLRQSAAERQLRAAKAEADLARATLARYFSPSIAALVSGQSGELPMGGERRVATFLFTDLANFTALVEATDPLIVVELLNAYFDGVARIIFAHDGTVMKVIGDAIQAAFGAPLDQHDHAARAVRCALELDDFAQAFRAQWRERGIALGVTRIGINTGSAIIGNFGGETFFDYTAYGSAVNIAARLESANKFLGTRICVSESAVAEIDGFTGRPSGDLSLAGRAATLRAYEPLAPDHAATPGMAAYCAAFAQLEAGQPEARQAFAALLGQMPEDPLVLLHLQRALAGADDVRVGTASHRLGQGQS